LADDMMPDAMSDDAVTAGAAAWSRLRERSATWQDWLLVGEALLIGRGEAMAKAKSNKPFGKIYSRFFGGWLRARGFVGISNQERYRAILCAEHKTEIEAWRATLTEAKRRRFNHPGSVWAHWQGARPATEPTHRVAAVFGRPQNRGKPIFWSQDVVRRGADGMRKCRSNDYFVLSRACLEGALRNEDDVASVLATRPKAAPDAMFAEAQALPEPMPRAKESPRGPRRPKKAKPVEPTLLPAIA
jgi:hypothetical protein